MSKTRKTTEKQSGAAEHRAPIATGRNEAPPPSRSETLHKLYISLLRSRRLQEHARAEGDWASAYDLVLGLEAVFVGAAVELTTTDTVTASRKNLAALIARGATAKELFSPRCAGVAAQYSMPVFPEDPFHVGVGIALAHKLEKKGNVVVAFCDQPDASLDHWRDALKIAAAQRLPVILVIEGQADADGDAQQLEKVNFSVRGVEIPGIVVDGSDVVAVWRVAHEGIHRARRGSGPTFIDCRTDPARDPLAHMQSYLEKRHEWDDNWNRKLEREIRQEIQAANIKRSPARR
jgi:TPP-dependent pyruvate/acetoin dehydrogenase alpha subunit